LFENVVKFSKANDDPQLTAKAAEFGFNTLNAVKFIAVARIQ